jgi:catechol 2,3-dioxygenase
MTKTEPIFDIAQLAHIEMYTPDMARSMRYFKDLLGMQETARDGDSIYLRAYEDFYHHTLKLTQRDFAGLGHCSWRASSPHALERRVKAVEASGQGKGWIEGDLGHGRAFQFETPGGHRMEVFYEVEYWRCPTGLKTPLLNRPQKRPLHGIPVRRIDHINLMSPNPDADAQFMIEVLGFRERELVTPDDASTRLGSWLAVSNLAHDVAFVIDPSGMRGRLHHICYWYGSPQHAYDAGEMFQEQGIPIEAGPGKHGISQAFFMYVLEPGGNRVELFADSGYLVFDPTFKTVKWKMSEVPGRGDAWVGQAFPWSWWNEGTPRSNREEPIMVPAPARSEAAE